MTAIDPVTTIDPTTTIAPERHITVEGTVEIGRRLAVTAGRRSRASLETPDSEFRPPMPRFRGPRARLIQPVPFGEDPVRFIERDLRPTPDTVAFRDKGLALSYAVFGQPGSGKTHLLRNVLYDLLAGGPDNARLRLDPDQRFGALIVDPKGELVRDVVDILEATGRSDDLRLVNTQALERSGGGMNLLDVQLDPSEKAVALVLAAQCAGESPKDPFWVKSWTNVFIGAAHILHALGRDVTLAALVEATMGRDAGADARLAGDDTTQRSPLRAKRAVEVLVATAFGDFCRAKYKACYSAKHPAPKYRRLYDQIIEDGRVVVVSNGFEERNFTGALVPLVKTLFQRTVLSRFSLADDERLRTRDVRSSCCATSTRRLSARSPERTSETRTSSTWRASSDAWGSWPPNHSAPYAPPWRRMTNAPGRRSTPASARRSSFAPKTRTPLSRPSTPPERPMPS
jgi:hypothetical protein